MMDQDLKPWILEVNTNPSLSCSSPLDKMLKTSLVCDMYNIVGFKVKHAPKVPKEGVDEKPKIGKKKKSTIERRRKELDDRHISQRNKSIDANFASIKAKTEVKMKPKKREDLILKTIDEDYRKGDFEKLFPLATNVDKYKPLF